MLGCFKRPMTAALVLLAATAARGRCAQVVEPTGQAAIAWHLDTISNGILGPNRPDAVWRQSVALLKAAHELDPAEPRFARLQTLALTHLGDAPGAIDALLTYRKIDAVTRADQVAQLQLINLYLAQMQTLDARIAYLQTLVDKQDVPREVRARLAVEATMLLAQKSPDLAAAMAAKAVSIYPLAEAARLNYRYNTSKKTGLDDRVEAILAVLRADPNQANYVIELARLLARNGQPGESTRWYGLAISLTSGRPAWFHDLLIDYVSQMLLAGRLNVARATIDRILAGEPLDADGWFLKLLADKAVSPKVYAATLERARAAFVRRWNTFDAQTLTGNAATQPSDLAPQLPTTAPAQIKPIDWKPLAARLKADHNTAGLDAFVSVVSDVAWFDLYFDNSPTAASPWIDALRAVVPADSLILRRLEGWRDLLSGQPKEARQLLSKNPGDALSELGLLRADELENKPAAPGAVAALLDKDRLGLVAAILWTQYKSPALRPATQPAKATIADLDSFAHVYLWVLDPMTVSRVYTIVAEPLETEVVFGAPVLAKVTLENISNFDITIGADALLHPGLWFNARMLGLQGQFYPGVAYDNIDHQIVLHSRSSISQIVRLDAGKLRKALEASPGSSTVQCDVITNPVPYPDPTTGQDRAYPGAGGAGVNFFRTFTYTGIPISLPSGKKDLQDALTAKSEVTRIHVADLMAAFIRMARNPNVDPGVHKAAADLPAKLAALRSDASPLVAGWADYVSSGLVEGADRRKIVAAMNASPQWTTRLLSLFAGQGLPTADQKELAGKLQSDANATVKSAAEATMELLSQATAPPSTQPAP